VRSNFLSEISGTALSLIINMATLVMFFGGVQLFSIGILGVYISRIYREVKQRPLFIVSELVNVEEVPRT
jgi:hypothetical protein